MQYRSILWVVFVSLALIAAPDTVFAAKKKKDPKPKSPKGGVVVTTADMFEVDFNGERIQCKRGTVNEAGRVIEKKGTLFFVPEAKLAKDQVKKLQAKIKNASNKKKAKKKFGEKIDEINANRDAKNGACVVSTQLPPDTVPLPSECVDLSRYDGPWGVAQVRRLFAKSAWAANTMEQQEGAALGLDHTVDNMLLRANGMVPTGDLGVKMYDWLDGRLGNLTGADPQEPQDLNTDGIRYSRLENYLSNPNKFYTYLTALLNEQIAASYRVLGGNSYHFFFEYWSLLENLALTGDHRAFIEKIGQDPLYMLVWLNLRSSSVQPGKEPNEDGTREFMQLASMTGQVNKGDPNGGLNYTNRDIEVLSYPMVYGGDVRYDNETRRDEKIIITGRAYQGPPVEVGVEGTSFMPRRFIANYSDYVALVRDHPGTANGVANFLIENYLYRNPPASFVAALGNIIREDGLNFKTRALPMLLKSKAMQSSCASNSIAKSPLQFYISFLQTTGIPVDIDLLDDEIRGAGQTVGNPTTVFGYQYDSGFTGRRLQALENGLIDLMRQNSYLTNQGWFYSTLFPQFGATAGQVIDSICQERLGIDYSRNPTLRDQLLQYADFRLRNDGSFERRVFDSYYEVKTNSQGKTELTNRTNWEPKVHGFLQICAMTTDFLAK